MRKLTVLAVVAAVAVVVAALVFAACGSTSRGSQQQPTYQSKNFIERQKFNRRLQISDDPSTVLFCTAFPFDAKPFTVPIAGKLVSGTKRPDPPTNEGDNGQVGTEREDAQGMYGPSVPYRFGFTPGGVYEDFTDLPTECSTQAKSYKETSIGLVSSPNSALSAAGAQAQAVLREGLIYGPGHKFEAYSPESQVRAQAIIDNAVNAQSHGAVAGGPGR